MSRLLSIEMKALYVLGVACLTTFAWWGIDRKPPATERTYLVEELVTAGSGAYVRRDIDRRRACSSRVEWYLFDAGRVRFAYETVETLNPGEPGDDVIITELHVPLTAKPGKGHFRMVKSWVCNPTHLLWPIIRVIEVPVTIQSPIKPILSAHEE